MLLLLFIVFAAGVVGGALNAFISDNGFIVPQRLKVDDAEILRPGFLGNMLVGGVAAVVSWGLYGPLSAALVVGSSTSSTGGAAADPGLSLGSLVGAVLVGVGGAKWLTNEVDKRLLKSAATQAAMGRPSEDKAVSIANATPAQALQIARSMR